MKKITLFLMALFSCLLVGCGEKELAPIDVLTKTFEQMENAKSLEMTMNVKASYQDDGMGINMELPLTISASSNENEVNAKIAVGKNMFIGDLEAYLNINQNDQKIDIYMPSTIIDNMYGIENEKIDWLHYGAKIDDLDDESIEIDTAELEKLKNIDYKKVIGDNFVYVDKADNIKHYQFIINQGLIERLATELGEEFTDDMKFDFDFKLDFYIDKDYNLTKIKADFKELMKEIEPDEEMVNFDEFSLTMDFKNINNTTVTVADMIKNNAIELEVYLETLEMPNEIY